MTTPQEELLVRVRARRVLPIPAERRQIREEARVTQHELARALGVSWTAIWRWEQGARPRNPEHEVAYSELLRQLRDAAA
jgi:DNA-binding transcriptional regulator YiaG